MYPVLFKLGPLTIYTYGFFVLLGVIITYWLSLKETAWQGIDKNSFSNLFFWTIIFSFVGARFLYIVVEWRIFVEYPLRVVLGRSGFVFYGGVIGGLLALYVLVKKYNLKFLKVADILALYIPLGHAIGRIGCFCYGCCYGRPTDSWIGIQFPPHSPAGILGTKVIPTQLISLFFLLIIFFILLNIKRRKKFNGQIFLSYLVIYGIFRFIIEFFRGDPRGYIWIFSTSQWISIIVVVLSVYYWLRSRKTLHRE